MTSFLSKTVKTLSHRYDAENGILWVTTPQIFDLSDIESLMTFLAESSEHSMDVETIWDLSELDFGPINREMIETMISRRSEISARRESRIALVAGSDLGFGMCRMYQTMSEAKGAVSPGKIHVARTKQEAFDWLISQRDAAKAH